MLKRRGQTASQPSSMTIAATTTATPDATAQALLASFERSGYARVAPAILQPAEPDPLGE